MDWDLEFNVVRATTRLADALDFVEEDIKKQYLGFALYFPLSNKDTVLELFVAQSMQIQNNIQYKKSCDAYTGLGAYTWNGLLRMGKMNELTEILAEIKQFDEMFEKLPRPSGPLVVYRGLTLSPNLVEVLLRDPAYVSTSLEPAVPFNDFAEFGDSRFAEQMSQKTRIMLKIDVPAGSRVIFAPACRRVFQGTGKMNIEWEIILPRGAMSRMRPISKLVIHHPKYSFLLLHFQYSDV